MVREHDVIHAAETRYLVLRPRPGLDYDQFRLELHETPNLVDTLPLDRKAWGRYSDDFVKYSSEAEPENMVKLINQYLKNLKEGNTNLPEECGHSVDHEVHLAVWQFCKDVSEEGSVPQGFLEYVDPPQDYQVVDVAVGMKVVNRSTISEDWSKN